MRKRRSPAMARAGSREDDADIDVFIEFIENPE